MRHQWCTRQLVTRSPSRRRCGDGGDGGGGGGATSEVATFGVFLSSRGGGEELRNEAAGVGARTRPADPAHPHSAGLGYGAHSAACRCGGGRVRGTRMLSEHCRAGSAQRGRWSPLFFVARRERAGAQAPSFLIYILEFRILAKVLAPGFVRYRPYLSVRFSDETRKRRNVRN